MSAAQPENPQSWNRYAYVLNNPLSFVDPTGLTCFQIDGDGNPTDNVLAGVSSLDECNNQNGFWIDNVQETITVTADPLPSGFVLWWINWWQSFKAIDSVQLSKQLNRCAAKNVDELYNKALRGNKFANAVAGNAFAGLSQLALGPDRMQGGIDSATDAGIHKLLPQAIGRTVGQIPILRGTVIASVPGTAIELGGQTRWATMVERYTATAAKDLPAFKSAFGFLEDALDGALV